MIMIRRWWRFVSLESQQQYGKLSKNKKQKHRHKKPQNRVEKNKQTNKLRVLWETIKKMEKKVITASYTYSYCGMCMT